MFTNTHKEKKNLTGFKTKWLFQRPKIDYYHPKTVKRY